MIYTITKGSSKTISRVGLNNRGYPLNLTGATISITAKQFGDASTTLFTKTSEDSSEIEVIDASRGIFLLKILAADTSSIDFRNLYCLQTIVISGTTYIDVFYLRLKGNRVAILPVTTPPRLRGTTAQRPTLTADEYIGFEYFDTDISSPVWWNGSEWV